MIKYHIVHDIIDFYRNVCYICINKITQGGIKMGFFKNLKNGMAAQKKLVDAINNGDLVVDRQNLTITPAEQNQSEKVKKTEENTDKK